MDNKILVSQNNDVLTIKLNRLNKLNTISNNMYQSLAEILDMANNNKSIKCIL